MTVIQDPEAFRKSVLGNGPVTKASGTLASSAIPVFTVAGGEVMITSVWLKVTTAISTDAGTVALQQNPTTGDTQTLVTATDLGTTDTAVGSVVGLDTNGTTLTAPKFLRGGRSDINWVITTGQVEILPASANGAVTIGVTWVPLTTGATLVAA
jgi:hypothetical protein